MLKKIPKLLSPQIIKTLMEMGHGDEILIADANYPAETNNNNVIRADGINATDCLKSILELFPLDSYSEYQALLMGVVSGDDIIPTIWEDYKNIINKNYHEATINHIDRHEFYKHSNKCFAIIQTGETALYGNIIIKKGVI